MRTKFSAISCFAVLSAAAIYAGNNLPNPLTANSTVDETESQSVTSV